MALYRLFADRRTFGLGTSRAHVTRKRLVAEGVRVIFGIGVDVCQISRIERTLDRFGDRFARRILDDVELDDYTRARRPARFLAMRFAAKEALSKALGTGFKQGVTPRQIGVRHAPSGKPKLMCDGTARHLLESLAVSASHISLSDDADVAVAVVVLEHDPTARG